MMTSTLSREPVLVGFLALVGAALTVLVAFGVDLTDAQAHALRSLAEAGFVFALLIRSKVVPT